MFKRITIILFILAMLAACGGDQAVEEGDDLTLNTTIAINDLPHIGPVSLRQTQMISGNIMRTITSTSVTMGGESQEIIDVLIMNLDQGNVYFVNDLDSVYAQMSLAELDTLLMRGEEVPDTIQAPLEISESRIERLDDQTREMDGFGPAVPVEVEMTITGTGENSDFSGSLSGQLWFSSALENADVFISYQKRANQLLDAQLNSPFFGISDYLQIDPGWMNEVSDKTTGIPVKGDMMVEMPLKDQTITFGISLTLEDYNTTNISEDLLTIPDGYRQVSYDEYRGY